MGMARWVRAGEGAVCSSTVKIIQLRHRVFQDYVVDFDPGGVLL